jgi:hypothetical protein
MRILAVLNKYDFVNPTRGLLVDAFARRPGVRLVGPGFGELPRDIADLQSQEGKFDVILIESDLFAFHGEPVHAKITGADRPDWPRDLFDAGLPIVVFNILSDLHGAKPDYWRRLRAADAFMVNASSSPQFFKAHAEMVGEETWIDPRAEYFAPGTIDDRALLLPHCVAPGEFIPFGSRRKRHDVAAMGADYWFRRQTRKWCAENGVSCVSMMTLSHRILTDYLLKYGDFFWRLWKRRFVKYVEQARLGVTCDGTIGYPIRKFFEIPAFGVPLAAAFFKDPEALGYKDGQTCFHLSADRFERIDEILEAFQSDAGFARRIAEAGQEMVRECHLVERRAAQLVALLEAIASRELRTTRWRDGRQILVRKDGSSSAPL